MKTIRNTLTEDIQRVSDEEAFAMVKGDWAFCSKKVWKEKVRDKDKAVKPKKSDKKGQKDERSAKKDSRGHKKSGKPTKPTRAAKPESKYARKKAQA